MPKILDVGCGTSKSENAVGLDFYDLPGVDVVHDLNQYPWPFEVGTFDEVHILDVLEHLDQPIRAMEEIYRVLKLGGEIYIRVVPWNHYYAFSDPTHKWFFAEKYFDFFTPSTQRGYYTTARFEKVSIKRTYDVTARKWFRFEWLMNFLSQFLCNVIDGLHIRMKKVAPAEKVAHFDGKTSK